MPPDQEEEIEDQEEEDLDLEDDPDAEDEEDEPEDEEPEEEIGRPYVAPVAHVGEDDDDALLREGMTPELYEAMMRKMRKEMASEMQTMAAANIHVTTAAAEHPELFRSYGPRIQQTLSELPAATRSKPEAVHIAIARIVMEDGPAKGLGVTLRRLADMADGNAKPRTQQAKPKAPSIPPEQRPPSPSSRGKDARPLSSYDRKVDLMMKDGGLTREQARVMVSSGEV